MTFGEKLLKARLVHNLKQRELGAKCGVSERSIYSYEQMGILPRTNTLKKLAEVLGVSVSYLMDEEETDPQKDISDEIFIANVRNQYGHKGAREAQEILTRASALFAGGELSEESKELFIQSLMETYLESKAEARNKFGSRRRVSRKSSNNDILVDSDGDN